MKPLYVALFIPLFTSAMVVAPLVSSAKSHPGTGNAFGHFIAPGWLKKNDMPLLGDMSLPPGITKKLGLDDDDDDEPEDTTGPIISNIEVDSTNTTTTITWDTDEAAESAVHVSTTSPVDPSDSETLTESDTNFVTAHEAMFDSLTPSTTHHALIVVTDEHGNTSTSSEFSFTTNEEPDTDAPVISAVTLSVGTSTADVSWTTDESASSRVYYATSTSFGLSDPGVETVEDTGLVTSHSLLLSGLATSTTYYTRIESKDASDNTTVSGEMDFTTGS